MLWVQAVSLADYPRRGGQLCGRFGNTRMAGAAARGRLTGGSGRCGSFGKQSPRSHSMRRNHDREGAERSLPRPLP